MAKILRRSLLPSIQKRYCTISTILPPPFTVQSSGYSSESAPSVSKDPQIDEKGDKKSASLLNSLKAYGFNETHIRNLIKSNPIVLRCRAETNFKPKLEWLVENGFTGTILTELIVLNPHIITCSLDSKLKPTFEFLKQFLDTNEKIVTAVKRSGWSLCVNNTLQQNIQFLISEGVPVDRVSYLLTLQPRAILQSQDRMAYAVKTVKDTGLAPDAFKFVQCLRVVIQMTESNLKKKLEFLKSLGWSDEQLSSTLKMYPSCLGCSEENLRRKIDFYLNTLELERKTVIAYPALLMYSLDKRIRPRCKVIKILQSKKLIKRGKKIVRMLLLGEKKFLEEYVIKHVDKAPGLLDMYCSSLNQRKNQPGENEQYVSEDLNKLFPYLESNCPDATIKSAVQLSLKCCITWDGLHNKCQVFEGRGICLCCCSTSTFSPLFLGAQTNFKPKLEWFIENGFTGTILTDLISLNRYIITWSLDYKLKPIFLLLKQFLDTNEKIVTAVKRSGCWLSNNITLEQNFQFLISEGVPVNRISYLLTAQPRAMLKSHGRIAYAVKTVKDTGLAPDALRFIHLLRVVIQLTESKLKKKLEVLKRLGWSDEQLLNTLKKYPICLSYSEENLRSKMDFYLNIMKLKRETVIARPVLMTLSAEKRIHPRYEVMNILGSKKLIKDGLKMIRVMEISEERFLKMCVMKHVDNVPGLLAMYCSIINQRKKTDRAKQLTS